MLYNILKNVKRKGEKRRARWLDQHAGKGDCFTGAQAGAGLQDAALVYFVDEKMAAAFVDHFACGLIVGREPPVSVTPTWR